MAKNIMGKILGGNKIVRISLSFFMILLIGGLSTADSGEDVLFSKAYEYYLSYRPEKAVEFFDVFLRNYPDSSAKDAAFFWKAKSLYQLKRTDEAMKLFADIQTKFPASPFILFVDRELSNCRSSFSMQASKDLLKDGNPLHDKAEDRLTELEGEKAFLEDQMAIMEAQTINAEKAFSVADKEKKRLEVLLAEAREEKRKLSERIMVKDLRISESEKNISVLKEKIKKLSKRTTKRLRTRH